MKIYDAYFSHDSRYYFSRLGFKSRKILFSHEENFEGSGFIDFTIFMVFGGLREVF